MEKSENERNGRERNFFQGLGKFESGKRESEGKSVRERREIVP